MVRDNSLHRSLSFIPVARILLGIIFIMSSGPTTATPQTLTGDRLGEGLSISTWNPQAQCPDVAPLIAVEIDPNRYRFTVHYYQQEGLSDPLDIRQWQERTGHDLVFNAGLFRENYAYLGLLYGNGRSLGSKRHSTWLGLFVAEPAEDRSRRARVLDLTFDTFDEQHVPYREVAQSLMLLDRTGKIRVRHAHIRPSSQNKAMGISSSSRLRRWYRSMPLGNACGTPFLPCAKSWPWTEDPLLISPSVPRSGKPRLNLPVYTAGYLC
jgi:hypothetical protein